MKVYLSEYKYKKDVYLYVCNILQTSGLMHEPKSRTLKLYFEFKKYDVNFNLIELSYFPIQNGKIEWDNETTYIVNRGYDRYKGLDMKSYFNQKIKTWSIFQ